MRGSDIFAEDMPLLNTPNLVALVLRAAKQGGVSAELCADRLEALFRQTGERQQVDRDELVARCGKTVVWLREAGLLEAGDRRWVLTAGGRQALADHPQGMDLADLAAYPKFAAYLEKREQGRAGGLDPRSTSYDEGFTACHEGRSFTDNPYDFGSADHQLWENGWCEALDEEEGPGVSPVTGSRRDAN